MGLGSNLRADPEAVTVRDKFPVKLEIEDSLEEEHGPLNKRFKPAAPFNECDTGNDKFPIPPSQYNPLDEPSPLGLRLKKSPSLLDLIQMRLSHVKDASAPTASASASASTSPTGNLSLRRNKDVKGTTAAATTDKLKASNFPALLLRIGQWEYVSRFEGDLVAKCYFAKHKLVWEILEGGLKSKIEIQWSDIMALKANCPDDGPGSLTVMLARPPHFFKETNPQPRKHTLWQASVDFTDGQASVHRQHFLQCAHGLLSKHYEKLIQCDTRLNLVSREPAMVFDSPYFEERGSFFKDQNESKLQDVASPYAAQSSSSKIEEQTSAGTTSDNLSPEAPSPSSVMDLHATEGNGSHEGDGFQAQQDCEQLIVSGLRPSMSMSDLVNHIGHRISERMASGNSISSKEALEHKDMLDNIAQILLNDTQFTTASDEKTLMSRVNSLCCLLQDPTTAQNAEDDGENHLERLDGGKQIQGNYAYESMHENSGGSKFGFPGESKDVSTSKQAPAMSRKDSFGDLLLNLPRIASLPKCLFDISEHDEARH